MDAELRARWITALRSGEFQQHRRKLCNDVRSAFCCLGVLAVVKDPNADLNEEDEFDPYCELDKLIGGSDVRATLVRMNDAQDASFPEIADWVEQNIGAAIMPNKRGNET